MSSVSLQAVLWDLDGVIADTADYHYRAWKEIFAERGFYFKKEDFMQFFGRRHDTIIRFALGNTLSLEEFEAVTERKQQTYRRLVKEHISALPGAIEMIRSLNAAGIPTAIASSAPVPNINIIIEGLGIAGCFQAVASGLEVAQGKPDPAIFLLAAEKLGVPPAGCCVFEDAVAGVAAAGAAGMKCIAVTNSHPRESLRQADRIVDSLADITLDDIKALFK